MLEVVARETFSTGPGARRCRYGGEASLLLRRIGHGPLSDLLTTVARQRPRPGVVTTVPDASTGVDACMSALNGRASPGREGRLSFRRSVSVLWMVARQAGSLQATRSPRGATDSLKADRLILRTQPAGATVMIPRETIMHPTTGLTAVAERYTPHIAATSCLTSSQCEEAAYPDERQSLVLGLASRAGQSRRLHVHASSDLSRTLAATISCITSF